METTCTLDAHTTARLIATPMHELRNTLRNWLAAHPDGRLAVALSGGMDSMALLHALVELPEARQRGLRALHVDHGLYPDSRRWARYCRAFADSLGVPLRTMRVAVDVHAKGVEAGARDARYAAFARVLARDEWLLTAQHAEDQAETLLLKLMRGADLAGLGGMHRERALGRGRLARPLLDLPRTVLHAHALDHGLSWILDPSNRDPRYDRGYLRSEILPRLKDRWPAAVAALCRSASYLASERQRLDSELVAALDACATDDPRALDLPRLLDLPEPIRPRLLLAWLGRLGWPAPTMRQLAALLDQVETAPSERSPALHWNGRSLRRFRERLYAVVATPPLPAEWSVNWDLRRPLLLPGSDVLRIAGGRIPRRILKARPRQGGERIRLPGRMQSSSVKHALQALGLPPWQRGGLPFLWDGAELLAVGAVLVSAPFEAWLARHRLRIERRAGDVE
jgi:tRNA(Ile)-lysidine synthase